MAKLIDRALYKRERGQPLSRKERKAIEQHEAAPNKRKPGFCSYKANRSHVILDFGIDWQNDLLIPTRTMPYNEYNALTDEQKEELKKPADRRSWLYDDLAPEE